MLNELDTLLESKPFNEWQRLLAGNSDIIQLPTRQNLISGLCGDLGFYLKVRYGVPVFTISYLLPSWLITVTHVCVLFENMYYDGWNTKGVYHPSDLQWSRLLIDNHQVYDRETLVIYEGLLDNYYYIDYLAELKEILKKYPLYGS